MQLGEVLYETGLFAGHPSQLRWPQLEHLINISAALHSNYAREFTAVFNSMTDNCKPGLQLLEKAVSKYWKPDREMYKFGTKRKFKGMDLRTPTPFDSEELMLDAYDEISARMTDTGNEVSQAVLRIYDLGHNKKIHGARDIAAMVTISKMGGFGTGNVVMAGREWTGTQGAWWGKEIVLLSRGHIGSYYLSSLVETAYPQKRPKRKMIASS